MMDDHCILTFARNNWRIRRVLHGPGGRLVVEGVYLQNPAQTVAMDLSNVSWDEYQAAAVEKIARRDAEDVT